MPCETTIALSKEVRHELKILKAEGDFNSYNETLQHHLDL